MFENTYTFSDFKKHDFLRFFEMTYQKSQKKFSHRSVKMNSYTLLSDQCDSIPSGLGVIHSEPLLNLNGYRNFGFKIHF